MECMCAYTRPRFILSSERVLGEHSQNYRSVNFKGKILSTGKNLPRGGWNPRRYIKQDSEPNTLPTRYSGPVSYLFYSVLFYSRLCPSTTGSSPPLESSIFLSFVILVHTAPNCPTMSSLHRRFRRMVKSRTIYLRCTHYLVCLLLFSL